MPKNLNDLIGKTWMYNAYNQHVFNYKIIDGKIIISTDKEVISFNEEDIDQELNNFLPVENDLYLPATIDKSQILVFNESKSLSNTISETIEKLKTDPKFIPQAAEINKYINSAIQLGKVQLDAMKLMKK